jgi:hypothetical protein
MKSLLKKITPLYDLYLYSLKYYRRVRDRMIIPDYVTKRKIILSTASKYKYTKVFVETGTYMGDTIEALKTHFERLYSIELNQELATKAVQRFAGHPHISIMQGDSALQLTSILSTVETPVVFWLDGHYSSEFQVGSEYIVTGKGEKNTPVLEELAQIAEHKIKNHAILIDDAREFNGTNDYPSLLELKAFVGQKMPNHVVTVKTDIIRILP